MPGSIEEPLPVFDVRPLVHLDGTLNSSTGGGPASGVPLDPLDPLEPASALPPELEEPELPDVEPELVEPELLAPDEPEDEPPELEELAPDEEELPPELLDAPVVPSPVGIMVCDGSSELPEQAVSDPLPNTAAIARGTLNARAPNFAFMAMRLRTTARLLFDDERCDMVLLLGVTNPNDVSVHETSARCTQIGEQKCENSAENCVFAPRL